MIQARILRKFSESFTLQVQFEAHPGITVLFGPSGGGKTQTLDCIAGFTRPDSGRILIDDAIVFDSGTNVHLRPQDRHCGYVFQDYALFPHMTVRENLLFATNRRGDARRRVNEMLERFQLTEVAGRHPQAVSGGQKQRCSIARALLSQPRALLLDEPAQGLDSSLRGDFHNVLREVRTTYETPIVLVTHSLDECFELGDRMLVLNGGHIVQQGTPAEVCSKPATADLARLLGIFNILPVEIRSLDPSRNQSVLRWGDYEVQGEYYPGHLNGDRVQLLVTPRQLAAMPRTGRPGPNQVPVELVRVVEMADLMRLEFGGGLIVETTRGPVDRNNGNWLVEFPTHGLRIL